MERSPSFDSIDNVMTETADLYLSVVMPAYNEESTLRQIVGQVMAVPHLLELIIVDDCSTDRTPEIATALADADARIRYIRQPRNLGKTAALKRAFALTRGDIVVIQDADLEYDPAEITDVIAPIVAGRADVVYGSRFLVKRATRVLYFYHYLANKFLTFASNCLTNLNMTDVETCYKAFRGEVIRNMNITSSHFGFEIEVTAKVAKLECAVYEVPISYYGRTYEEGKKISFQDGIAALWYVFKFNLFVGLRKSYHRPPRLITNPNGRPGPGDIHPVDRQSAYPTNRTLLARLDTPVACQLALMTVLCLFTAGRLYQADFDPSAFVVAGDHYSNPHEVPRGLAVLENSDGYDGQFYYRLALNPFTSKVTDSGISLDNPPFRHQRFLYPFIVRLASFGNDRLVPIAMIGTNFVFYCVLAWVAGRLAQTSNRHALWGMLIVFNPGFLFSYSRDLVEIVEMTFLLGSLLLIRQNRPGWATVLLTFAVLTRETSILVAIAAAIAFAFATNLLRGRTEHRFTPYYFAIPICAMCLLQLALFINWGAFPVRAGGTVLAAFPLAGFTDSLPRGSDTLNDGQRMLFVAPTFVVLSTLAIGYRLLAARAASWEVVCCLLYGALLLSVGPLVWAEDVSFLRVFTHFYVFGAVVVIASSSTAIAGFLLLLASTTWFVDYRRLILYT